MVGVVLRQAWSKSQWTVLMGYFTISTNVRRHQTHHIWQFFSFRKTAHRCIVCVTQSNWVKFEIFVFPRLTGSAEAQVTWGGIVKRLLIACFIGNISAKKYQNPFVCVKVIARQRWDVFLRHGVQTCKLYSIRVLSRSHCDHSCASYITLCTWTLITHSSRLCFVTLCLQAVPISCNAYANGRLSNCSVGDNHDRALKVLCLALSVHSQSHTFWRRELSNHSLNKNNLYISFMYSYTRGVCVASTADMTDGGGIVQYTTGPRTLSCQKPTKSWLCRDRVRN